MTASATCDAPLDEVNGTNEQLMPPIFVLSTARAGSTLLSFIMDAHPDLCCPAETNICAVFSALAVTAHNLHGGESEEQVADSTLDLCRAAANGLHGNYARSQGVGRWCDKSLMNVELAGLLLKVFPDARFVCLYRDCRDTIASLLDASPWGYNGFGIGPYVAGSPNNVVMALGRYWSDKTEQALSFAEQHPEACYRIRYEDLVTQPLETCEPLFAQFLQLSWSSEYVANEAVFTDERKRRHGPGDLKISYMNTFETTSIGRGWRIPQTLFPPALRARIDKLSEELGYPPLDEDILGEDATDVEEALDGVAVDPLGTSVETVPTDETIVDLFERHATARMQEVSFPDAIEPLHAVKVALLDLRKSWVLDFAGRSVDQTNRPTYVTLATDTETLLGLASGEYNPAIALKRQEVKIIAEEQTSEAARREHFGRFIQVIRDE